MRILITVAHHYRQAGDGPALHGSYGPDAAGRAAAMTRCIANIHQLFGRRQALIYPPQRCVRQANETTAADVDVVICTTGGQHLLDHVPANFYAHQPVQCDPRLLGYECHAVLRDRLGRYDWYGYMEDDILISDPLHFVKLQWFIDLAGDEAVLQPNRFERAIHTPLHKLYIDGDLVDASISPRFQNVRDRPRIEAKTLGRRWVFQRVDNPHAGCFFLNENQMRTWAARPDFMDRAAGFWGPLESAATLGIMRTFRTYKPARENASFFEVEHAHVGYLGRRLTFHPDPPYRF